MTRPKDTPDPRSLDSPIRMDNVRIDKARGRKSLADLLQEWTNNYYARLPISFEPLVLPEIAEDRLRELRSRRDAILAALRERWGSYGG